ncbi:glycosyltransferase family 1 protein [Metabacillus indicus]|uniref:glycosyltransferase family 1 protein n=1 Tax=Metabacillus indicus TaxID=246786 RepID=UPI0039840413
MKPIRVLQVVTIMNRGGLETMLMNYYRKIDRSKIQFDFMVHRLDRGHYDDEIEKLGGQIFRMPAIRPGNYNLYFNLLKDFFVKNRDYRIVHAHNNENSSFVLHAAKEAHVPCRIAHSHLSDLGLDFKFPFRLYARYYMKKSPTDYFACSKKAGTWLFGDRSDVTVLNNAVNAEEFQFNVYKRKEIRRELKLKNELVVGHIGRFNKQKNHSFLIDIFKEICSKKPDAVLLLAGEGQLKKEIEEKVMKLGLSDNVRFLGVREDIPNIMQAMDIFLFPSLFEGLPVVLVEAQAAGLPVFASAAITKETNVTGSISFVNLKEPASKWASKILSVKPNRNNTVSILREKGYDTTSMSKWLAEFYIEKSETTVGV